MLRTRVALSLLLCLLTAECIAVENPPTVEDINTLAELAVLTTNGFYQHTFEVRMRYEFAGSFFSEEDRLALYDSARNSSGQLADFISRFEDTIRCIEQYSKEDWEQLFGRTGLYEKASGCLLSTRLSRFGIDYYAALAADKDVSVLAEKLLEQIDSLNEAGYSFYPQLIKGRALVLLARNDRSYVPAAEKVFSELCEKSNTNQRLVFMAAIEQAKLKSADEQTDADRLARDFIDSKLTDDLEVFLLLAFLERRLGLVDSYNELLRSNPKARFIAADITLGWFEAGRDPANLLDAALAAEAALRDGPQKHRELLIKLAGQNTSASPVVDYAAALVLADSNAPDAVYLLLRACEVLDTQSAEVLGLSAGQIAEQAARLAYRVFLKDPNKCGPVTDAFENYFELAGRAAEPNLQYVYTQVLTLCGHSQEAVDMLMKISPSAGRIYSRAQLDLLSARMASGQDSSIFHRVIYGKLYSRYLHDKSDCIYIEPATTFLQGYLEEIEVLQSNLPAYIQTIEDSKKIARFLYDCVQDRSRASILAEFIALDPNSTAEESTEAGDLLADIQSANKLDMLRAQARLAQRSNDYAEAARLWARVAERNETVNINSRSWRWWRAKYYQLECAAKAGNNNAEVAHAVDVLLATYNDVPADWAEKLKSLSSAFGETSTFGGQDCGD
jgi:hypothetical protein